MTWTHADRLASWRLGWGLFVDCDSGLLQIQALDDPVGVAAESDIEINVTYQGPKRDAVATRDVSRRAKKGDHLSVRALEEIRVYNLRVRVAEKQRPRS